MVLYIAKRGPHDMGTSTHRRAIQAIYGDENVYEVDLYNRVAIETKNYISFGFNLKKISDRIIRYIEGNIPNISNKIIGKICEIIEVNNVSLVFTEESDLGNLYRRIKGQFPYIKMICFFHDILADLFVQRINHVPKWKIHYILELKRGISQERVTTATMDACWVFHQADAERFQMHFGRNPDAMIPVASFTPPLQDNCYSVTEEKETKTILFVCSQYYVNADGFRWFYANVLPWLKGRYRIQLVGNGTGALADLSSDSQIEIVGEVDSMTMYYQQADIVIAPVFDGGGMKIKTLEAIAYGKCLISTGESLNGYWEYVPESLRGTLINRCNTAEEWIETTNRLICSKINRMNQEIYDLFVEFFSYERLVEQFRIALHKIQG